MQSTELGSLTFAITARAYLFTFISIMFPHLFNGEDNAGVTDLTSSGKNQERERV